MSNFAVTVERIAIASHPQADRLELAQVGDYQAIVLKGQFHTGDLIAYIPEQAIVPDCILQKLGLWDNATNKGKLAGSKGNRVKSVKIRGILSQGLVYPTLPGWQEGADVTELLGITKWEPPVPTHLSGEVYSAGTDRTLKYDVENFKKFPQLLVEGEEVVFTEKIHGTFALYGLVPKRMQHPEHGRLVISSKGLAARGLAMKPDAEANKANLYVRVARHLDIENRISLAFDPQLKGEDNLMPVFVLGEVFGKGCQDLVYGANTSVDNEIGFRIFDVYVGLPGQGHYLDSGELDAACVRLELDRVPVLYRGPFSKEVMLKYTDGYETVSGKELHIREGVVVRPSRERRCDEIGRVQLKSVSDNYLIRKGGTEFN